MHVPVSNTFLLYGLGEMVIKKMKVIKQFISDHSGWR